MFTRILFAFALLIPVCGYGGEIVLKFSHVVAPDTPKGKAAQKFKELAERYTKGKVKVLVFSNSQLFKDRDELEALQRGVVHMLAPSVSKFGPLGVRDFEIFDLPYLFRNVNEVHKVTDGEIGRQLFKKLEKRGIKGLAFWDNGFKHFSANRPLHKLADFRGLKMRIQSSKVLEATVRQLRGIPQVMAFSEVYTALQQGVVDGTENPISNLYTQKMHEVQAHLTLSYHGYLIYAVVANKKFWESLPENVRIELERALLDTTVYERRIAEEENQESLSLVKSSGFTKVHVLNVAERELWREQLEPVHKAFAKKYGSEVLDSIKKLLD